MQNLPLFFDTRAVAILLIGEGKGAVQRLRLLQATDANITILAENPSAELQRLADSHSNTHIEFRKFRTSDLSARLIFLAPETADERKEATAIAKQARHYKVPVNAIDDKALCDFYVPSLVNRSPVVVAIGTEGTAPLLARNIKADIERLLPDNLGKLAEYAGKLRTGIKSRLPHALRRHFWQAFFDSKQAKDYANSTGGGYALNLSVEKLLHNLQIEGRMDTITAPTLIGDLSPAEHHLLLEADTVIYEAQVPQAILNLVRRDAEFIPASDSSATINREERVVHLLNPPSPLTEQPHD